MNAGIRGGRAKALLAALALVFWLIPEADAQERGRGRVRGKVTTEEGEPIPHAKISLKHASYGIEVERTTDKKGNWVAAGLRGGQWLIDVYAEGYEPSLGRLEVSEAGRNKPIRTTLKKATAYLASEKEEALHAMTTEASQAFHAGDYQKALELFEKAVSEYPELERAQLNVGTCYVKLGKYQQGIASFKTFLEKHPGDSEALLLIGDAYILKGDTDAGIEYLEKVGLENVTDPLLCYNMGEIYFANGIPEKAAECYGKATRLDPSFREAFYKLALVAVGQNDPDTARPHLEKVIELAPDSPEAGMARQLLEQLGPPR